MFQRVDIIDERKVIEVELDGKAVFCREGDTVAAVVMLEGSRPYRRSILSGQARAPLCLMGICFECLVEIDGIPNQQGCLRAVAPGMRIARQLHQGGVITARGNRHE